MIDFINIILHLDIYLAQWSSFLGLWLYFVLFLIIFGETGFVILPFLPGDSLLFATGAIAAIESSDLNIHALALVLITAGILGDFVNYSIGKKLGPKVFRREDSKFLNKEHLNTTKNFFDRHGPKTIVIARFAPIIRTFAPFVAGIGRMNYSQFVVYNATGATLWVTSFLYAGYFFGNMPSVKHNFHLVIFGVIAVSFIPVIVGWLKRDKK